MKIEEIRAEIPKVYSTVYSMKQWLNMSGVENTNSMKIPEMIAAIALIFVDTAYKAGKAEIPECLECKSGDYEKGFKAGYEHACNKVNQSKILSDGYTMGFAEAAREPSAWYVLDKNGEQIHIGDTVIDEDGDEETVDYLGSACLVSDYGLIPHESNDCEKVTPDSWEQWEDDLETEIANALMAGQLNESYEGDLESLVNRVKKLAGIQ